MKLSVSQLAKLSGVSVRTLHYYDEIGLLTPSHVLDNGYRYYEEDKIERLQQILFYRELDFPLKQIPELLDSEVFDRMESFQQQRNLLELKKERLERLIGLLDEKLRGKNTMSFKEFGTTEIEEMKNKYAEEVKEKWGNTDAYTQSQQKTKNYGKEDWARIQKQSDDIMKRFFQTVGSDPSAENVQSLVKEWQSFITTNYYDCTTQILSGLAEMYVADERFQNNIDSFGAGTAQQMHDAIVIYCNQK